MSRERYEAEARKLLAQSALSADPNGAAEHALEQLELRTEDAEAWQASEERFVAQAVELMERAASARRVAARTSAERTRVESEREREKKRLRKNARARERYRQRRLTEPARFNKRTGMHALAIEVDPGAYSAVKIAAYRGNASIPKLLGEILTSDLERTASPTPSVEPRWRRTGQGRRANQHTRIDTAADIWEAVHLDALRRSLTVGRRVGLAIEHWGSEKRVDDD